MLEALGRNHYPSRCGEADGQSKIPNTAGQLRQCAKIFIRQLSWAGASNLSFNLKVKLVHASGCDNIWVP